MEKNTTQHEVLIITGTTFSSRQLSEKNSSPASKNRSEIEQLEEAFANGLLEEMLPELCAGSAEAKRVYLWGIKEGDSFVEFDFSEFPEETDKYFSLDPYSFLSERILN